MSNAKDRAQQLNAAAGNNANQNTSITSAPADNSQQSGIPSIQEQLAELAKPKYVLKAEPIDFGGTTQNLLITTLDLAKKVNGLFRPMFKDYAGSNIAIHTPGQNSPNANGANAMVGPNHQATAVSMPRIEVELFFSRGASIGRCAAGAIDSIVDTSKLTKNGKKDIGASIARVNETANPTNPLTINEMTREILDPFFMPYYKRTVMKTGEITDPATGQKVTKQVPISRANYDANLVFGVSEQTNHFMYAGNRTDYVKVIGLDLLLVIRHIFGNKNEEGHPVDYNVRIVRPIANYGVMPANALYALLEISMLDCVVMEDLCKNIGMMQTINGLPIVK